MTTDAPELGYDVPALIGMAEAVIQTPALVLDLDALERNITKMGRLAQEAGVAHRAHGKMHKSVDVARLQMRLGGAVGVCCQKVSEAEAFARGGITDILVTNQVRDPTKLARLARLPTLGAIIGICVDDLASVTELDGAARAAGCVLNAYVEIDIGSGRCGVTKPEQAVELARRIVATENLNFAGLQAYQGAMQHLSTFAERKAAAKSATEITKNVVAALSNAGLAPSTVTGAGTGSFEFEAASGIYTELQCGSYAFMDADYGRLLGADDTRLDQGTWENALFVLTSVMSATQLGRAVLDAGHKAHAVDSGYPTVFGRSDITVVDCSDEHAVVEISAGGLEINERLRLVPGHCDPTCNLHDWLVGVRKGVVETLWPVSARGKLW